MKITFIYFELQYNCSISLAIINLSMYLNYGFYPRYVCVGKGIIQTEFGTLHCFRHPLRVFNTCLIDKGGWLSIS